MGSKLNLNNKIFNAYQSQGNINNLIDRLEASINENIDNASKLSEIIKNIPGGTLVNILNKDSSLVPRCKFDLKLSLVSVNFIYCNLF